MTLLSAGYWPTTYWVESYWVNDYWQAYEIDLGGELLTPGYWPATYWPEAYWANDYCYWLAYGSEVVSRRVRKGFLLERKLSLDEIRRRDDRDLFELIKIIVQSGVLE